RRHLAFIRQREFYDLDLLLQLRQVGKVPLDEDDVEMTPLDLPGEFAQPPDQVRVFLAVRREIWAVIAEHEQPLLLLRDVLKRTTRILGIWDQKFLLPLEFGPEDLPQPGRAAPDEETLLFFTMPLELRHRLHNAMKTAFLGRVDRDQRIACANQH